MVPMLPQPFTTPIAAARFLETRKRGLIYDTCIPKSLVYAGGRGIAFATHTSVIAAPVFVIFQ